MYMSFLSPKDDIPQLLGIYFISWLIFNLSETL